MSIRQRYQFEAVTGLKVGRLNNGINTQFIVYRIGGTVIDAGPSNQWKYVRDFLSKQTVSQLLLTHHHEDHSGNAHSIAKLFSITPKAPMLAQAKLASGYKTPFLQKLVWGSPQPVMTHALKEVESLCTGESVMPVHTPGHAKDLTCFHIPELGYFFSGDLFIAKNLKMLRKDENLADLLLSLSRVVKLDFETVFCPHGGIIENGNAALSEKLKNILSTCEQAQYQFAKGDDIEQITRSILGEELMVAKLTQGNFCKRNLIEQAVTIDRSAFAQ